MRRIVITLLVLLAACAQNPAYREGLDLLEAGRVEPGLAKLEEASRRQPGNREIRQAYFHQRDLALQRLLLLAQGARQRGQHDDAEALLKRMLVIHPENPRALAGLEILKTDRRHRLQVAEAEELLKKGSSAAAAALLRRVLAENASNREAQQLLSRGEGEVLRAAAIGPQLAADLRQPISLELRDATLRQVFEAISRGTGVNFIFDRDVRQDQRTTIFVRNSSTEDVMRFALVTNQLERKVLSANTVLVYPITKTKDYQDLIVKTFFLTNADAKAVANMIKVLVKTKDLYIDEKLNTVVIRDTPDAVRMAERLVANQDRAEPEVMLEVEVMEISANALYELGLQWPNSLSLSVVGAAGTPGTVTLSEWRNRGPDLVRLSINDPLLALNLRNQLGRSSLLANPRIRVKNKDRAKVHIGDKVPVLTTTTTSTGFAAESVTYLEVGLKLEVEPTIFLDDDVGIKVGLEVSNIAREIRSASGSLTYQVGTRNATTTLRLKDGETQVLAGLISDEERKTVNQIPGLGDLPLAGRLFGSHLDNFNKTEIVLLITPRVLRNLVRPESRFEEFLGGTEMAIGAAPLQLSSAAPSSEAPARPPEQKHSATKVLLEVPAGVAVGQEFEVQIAIDSNDVLRGGLLDLAFDASRLRFVAAEPGALLGAADANASFRVSAPEGLGRLSVSFTTRNEVRGTGALVKMRFQSTGAAAGTPSLRLEAASLTNTTGQAISAQLPPPATISPAR